jgi:hypothetical protein
MFCLPFSLSLKIHPPKPIHPNIWNVKEKLFTHFPWPKSHTTKDSPSVQWM